MLSIKTLSNIKRFSYSVPLAWSYLILFIDCNKFERRTVGQCQLVDVAVVRLLKFSLRWTVPMKAETTKYVFSI